MASTLDPIMRATLHCAKVRKALAGYVEDDTAKILQQTDRELLGGLMVGIDLSKAFDLLSYSEMYSALRDTSMPEELCRIIMHIHVNTTLYIEHGGCTRTARMQRGLRQGCGIAPMIYACWTAKLCRDIDARMRSRGTSTASDQTWSQAHMSIFADVISTVSGR